MKTFDIEKNAIKALEKINSQKKDGQIGVYLIKEHRFYFLRFAGVKSVLIQKLIKDKNKRLVGIYDKRIKVEHLIQDIKDSYASINGFTSDLNAYLAQITGGVCDTCEYKDSYRQSDLDAMELYKEKNKFWEMFGLDVEKPYSEPKKEWYCKYFRDAKEVTIDSKGKYKACNKYSIEQKTRISMAINKIKPQFTNSTESLFMFAIIEQAIRDLHANDENTNEVKRFLSGEIPQAEISGVDSNWITETLISLGFNLTEAV